jgi:hypothetical protein
MGPYSTPAQGQYSMQAQQQAQYSMQPQALQQAQQAQQAMSFAPSAAYYARPGPGVSAVSVGGAMAQGGGEGSWVRGAAQQGVGGGGQGYGAGAGDGAEKALPRRGWLQSRRGDDP